jgi:hypothetical protein
MLGDMQADGGHGGWDTGGGDGSSGMPPVFLLFLAVFVAVLAGFTIGIDWLAGWQGAWRLLGIAPALAATVILSTGGAVIVAAIRERQ